MGGKALRDYLVQVPAARGRVIPDMASMRDDFPALWEPTTAIMGKSISAPTLDGNENTSWRRDAQHDLPGGSHAVDDFQYFLSICTLNGIG